jgi:hypothetical protein
MKLEAVPDYTALHLRIFKSQKASNTKKKKSSLNFKTFDVYLLKIRAENGDTSGWARSSQLQSAPLLMKLFTVP